MTLKGLIPAVDATLKSAWPPGAVLQGFSLPTGATGIEGDFFNYDGADGATSFDQRVLPTIQYGPKTAGAWGTVYKRVLPTSAKNLIDSKGISTDGIGACSVAMNVAENIYGAPAVGYGAAFTGVTSVWSSSGGRFYAASRAATTAGACVAGCTSPTYQTPPPMLQVVSVTVNTLPSATDGATASCGVGSMHANGIMYGVGAYTDKDGRFGLGRLSVIEESPSSGIVSTGTGVVQPGYAIVLTRQGALYSAYVLNSSGAKVAGSDLVANVANGYDGYFASGPGVFMSNSQDARLSSFYGVL